LTAGKPGLARTRPAVKPPTQSAYPTQPTARTRWILARRLPRQPVDPRQPTAFFTELERTDGGEIVPVATVLLTNRECPWRCLMCDLWKHTLTEPVPPGAIPAQIDFALARLREQPAAGWPAAQGPSASARAGSAWRQLKLYNAGSFFDPGAIPPADYPAIAARAARFERVIVECHPALVGQSGLHFRDLLAAETGGRAPGLEVALGLETIHPRVLPRLNKRMSLSHFARAAEFLVRHGIGLRVFVLVQPPFLGEPEALEWARRSMAFAFDCGASAVCLIPTRGGNGALDTLAAVGQFTPPRLATLETALAEGLALRRGRVLADLWDLPTFADCAVCLPARQARLQQMNLTQQILPPVECPECGGR
jgi:archaeosine synthase beta-subunit